MTEEKKSEKKLSDLEKLKIAYEPIKKKYGLPEFTELNILFDIEDIDPDQTELLLRRIRRAQIERVSGYLRFIETILNPTNAPIFIFKMIKSMNSEDKESLNKVYDSLNILEIENLRYDFDYNENKEAEFIKKIYELFSGIKSDMLNVIENMTKLKGKSSKEKASSYFG